ncbi:S8 family serine peptidase [Virgibacillus salexigens]|uniref:S8 family serine peptidase n=1 Tax=Virgibacillus salexigens TaxID=61016 RepID=UPI003081D82F
MGRILVLMCLLSIIPITSSFAAEPEDHIQSIIIEVEGDPNEHKEYVQTHYPSVEVVAVYTKLFNGIALQGEDQALDRMQSLDFVKNIHTVQTYEATEQTTTLEAAADPNAVFPAELNTTGYTGEGVKVGVIDTGIDYEHPDLQKNYQKGYDLVDLDDDPMETTSQQGIPTLHGSHVAGIIAADGDMKGVAPDADIYAYRALGPGGQGTSIQVIAAMEQAVEDGVDVMNLSLGNNVNGPDYPTSVAVNKAAQLGVAVVIANGNNGPGDWTVGSPATANKAMSVGASSPKQEIPFLYERWEDKKIEITPMAGSIPWDLNTFYDLVDAETTKDLDGKIALFQRGSIPFTEKARLAQEKGARAVVIYNKDEGAFQGMIDNKQQHIKIPVVSISKVDGEWLVDKLKDKQKVSLETHYQTKQQSIAEFSSRGPVTVNWNIKPDILAPGTSILSTVPGGYQVLQGTSMAAPHVAGAIALLKEAKPDWTNQQIYGALKTTAVQMKDGNKQLVQPIIQGMGLIKPQEAMETETILYDPQLAFGQITDYSQSKRENIVIENTTNETQTYRFNVPYKRAGYSWKLPTSFTLEPKEKKKVPIELKVTSPQLKTGVHQGWITLERKGKTYRLPYLFVNQSADNPKAMGFEFTLKPFSKEEFTYRLYLTEPTKRVEVDLYNPDTLMFERNLMTKEALDTGVNEGQIDKKKVGKSGHYLAIITIQLANGKYESYETMIAIP